MPGWRALASETEQLRAERDELATWKAEQQQALIAAVAVLSEIEGVKGPGLVEACESVVARLRAVVAERDEARANYQFVVERAADQHLDGYRELGARAAAAENRADDLRRQLGAARDDIAVLVALVREAIKRFWEPWARRFALTPSSRVPVAGRPRMQPIPGGWVERARAALSRLDQ